MDKPLVSVCINSYNVENYIVENIKSVIEQTYRNLQIIIVDDASSDKTVSIIKENFSDDRIELYERKVNYHISYTLNEAIGHAKGKYVFHVDSDDVLAPEIIEKQVDFLESHPDYAAAFTTLEVIDENGNICDQSFDYVRDWFKNPPENREKMLRFFYYNLNFLSHTGSMIRKSVLDEVGYHNGSLCYLHDYDLWTRVIIRYPIHVFKENLAFYRITDTNNSTFNLKMFKIHHYEQAMIAKRFIDSCPDDLFLRVFADKLRFKGEHTHEETELEKAFLLADGIYAYKQNKILCVMKLSELFSKPGYAEIAREKFGFTIRDFLDLEAENLLYDQAEVDSLKSVINSKDAEIENLNSIINNYSAQLNKSRKLSHFTVEFYIYGFLKLIKHLLKHTKNYISLSKKDGIKYKKLVMFYGYTCKNLGDDLFFETLFSRYPDVLFVAYASPDYGEFFGRYKNVKFYNYDLPYIKKINNLGRRLRMTELFQSLLLKRCDGAVHIGGSIYRQNAAYLTDYKIREKRMRKGKPFFSISSNFGPFYSDDYKQMWSKAFENSRDICFRDKYSYELFKDIKSVRYSPDVLFSFKAPPADTVKGKVAISVINPYLEVRNFDKSLCDAYLFSLKETVASLVLSGKTVDILGFCSAEKDNEFVEKLYSMLPEYTKSGVTRINYSFEDRDIILSSLSSAEYIVGTRLHSVILGIAMGKKVLPVAYGNKISNILSDIGFTGTVIRIEELENYRKTGFADVLFKTEVFDASALSDSADRQFSRMDEFLL